MIFDVIIVGGSYAGLSAGLQLARARRRVLVIDAGRRRNRFAASSHGFLGQDGRTPAEIAADGRAELMNYDNVEWIEGEAVSATGGIDNFRVGIGGKGHEVAGRRLLLALGLQDALPPVPGLAERWGRSVFHCPYCHGYELGRGPIGVLAVSPLSMHHALMLPDWGDTTLFLDEAFEPSAEDWAALERRGTQVDVGKVERIDGHADMVMADGRSLALKGLFVVPRVSPATPLGTSLGCDLEEGPMGQILQTDAMKQTSQPGVFACGDVARMAGSVALAVGDGAFAGASVHRSLMFG